MVDFAPSTADTTSYATLCYVPPEHYIGLTKFVENMEAFPADGRVIFYSDNAGDAVDRLKARKVDQMPNVNPTPIDIGNGIRLPASSGWVPSTYAFLDACRIAVDEKLDFFFYLETDCRVTQKGWDKALWNEHCRWPHRAVTSGTPAIWNPWMTEGAWRKAVGAYVSRYNKMSGVAMPVFGPNRASLNVYPNGALAFYKTDEVVEAFKEVLAAAPRGKESLKAMPFDYRFGQHLIWKYGLDVFNKIGQLPSSYSGCGNILMPEIKRFNMVSNKSKVAVHQIKSNVI